MSRGHPGGEKRTKGILHTGIHKCKAIQAGKNQVFSRTSTEVWKRVECEHLARLVGD